MMNDIVIKIAQKDDAKEIALLTEKLLMEIMETVGDYFFSFDLEEAILILESYISENIYVIFLALYEGKIIGFISLGESHAIYAGGVFGTILEFYVEPSYRSLYIGRMLLEEVKKFSDLKGYKRLEVTTPPLPAYERSLSFYKANGFCVTGGRKMKISL